MKTTAKPKSVITAVTAAEAESEISPAVSEGVEIARNSSLELVQLPRGTCVRLKSGTLVTIE